MINLELALHPQTILDYDVNGKSLPIPHWISCRLRVETQRGFKMVKYLRLIDLTEDYRTAGRGQAAGNDRWYRP